MELDTNLNVLVKQIDESGNRLQHKAETFSNRCDQLKDTVKDSIEQKINKMKKKEKSVINEVEVIKNEGKIRYNNISERVKTLKEKIELNIMNGQNSNNKVSTSSNLFLNLFFYENINLFSLSFAFFI